MPQMASFVAIISIVSTRTIRTHTQNVHIHGKKTKSISMNERNPKQKKTKQKNQAKEVTQ